MLNEAKKIAREHIQKCRDILGASKSDTFYDLNMTPSERGTLLRAAGLPFDNRHIERKFNAWNTTDKNKIKQAARRASQWAKGLEVAL